MPSTKETRRRLRRSGTSGGPAGLGKHHNTRPHDCRYLLPCDCGKNIWECLSPPLETAAYALKDNATIGEEQLLEEVRKLAVTNTRHVIMTPAEEVSAKKKVTMTSTDQEADNRETSVKTPQAGGWVKNQRRGLPSSPVSRPSSLSESWPPYSSLLINRSSLGRSSLHFESRSSPTPQHKNKTMEALVKTCQGCASYPQRGPLCRGLHDRYQDSGCIESQEASVQTPQAGGGAIRSTRSQEPSLTLSLARLPRTQEMSRCWSNPPRPGTASPTWQTESPGPPTRSSRRHHQGVGCGRANSERGRHHQPKRGVH